MKSVLRYSKMQLFSLVALRVIIGWYFLYEGLSKVFTPKWTAYGYLMDSKGLFAPFYHAIASNPTIMGVVDFINIWGLTLVGLFLILGLFERISYIGATVFLLLFFLSHPPILNAVYLLPPEGSYLWVDKNLVMLVATVVLFWFPTSRVVGLKRIILKNK